MVWRRISALAFLLFVGASAFAAYALRIDQIRVTGLRSLPARTIVAASGLEPGERILWIRLSAAERRIERLPAVASAVAERKLPATVVIHVRERVPVARLDKARDLVVDEQGVIFSGANQHVAPVLYGWAGRARAGATVGARSRAVLRAFPRFPESLRYYGRKLLVSDDSFVLTMVAGTQIRFGAPLDLDVKARAALGVLRAEKGHRLAYIDVSSPSVPVSRRAAPPTPEPTPTPAPTPAPAGSPPASPQGTPQPEPTSAPSATPH